MRRLLFEASEDIEDLMALCEADITSKNEERVQRHLENFANVREKMKEIEEKDSLRNFQPPVSGDDIRKAFGIEPGPVIGEIKNAIKEAILEGEISNNHEDAWKFMVEKGREFGLTLTNNTKDSDENS